MGWKNWPVWLRGGVIGAFCFLGIWGAIYILEPSSCHYEGFDSCWFGFSELFAMFASLPWIYAFELMGNPLVQVITGTFDFFVLGAIIGFLISKLKRKKR